MRMKKLLNIGGGDKESMQLPPELQDLEHVYLDIDPRTNPDIVLDARKLHTLPEGGYDFIWCSHCLEHFLSSDIPAVLKGFHHVLNAGGHVYITVPDLKEVFRVMLLNGADILDIAYVTDDGFMVSYADMIYGSHLIMMNGNEYYHHNYGFTAKSLQQILTAYGFETASLGEDGFSLHYVGKKGEANV